MLRSGHAGESEKSNAADLLGRISRDEQISTAYREQGLVMIQHEKLEQMTQHSRRQDTLRYEHECAKLATQRRGKLRWTQVSTDKKISHHGSKRQIDVFGLRRADDNDMLGVGECKLKMSSKVNHGEMKELVERMALALCEERHGKRRKVEGCFFSSSGYDEEALSLARRHHIRTFLAVPQKRWQNKADWTISVFREM